LRGEIRSLSQRPKLRPDHILCDTAPARRRIEAAIGSDENPGWIAYNGCHTLNPISDDLRVLDDVGEWIDDAGDQHLIGVQRRLGEATKLMRVARPGERQKQSADFRLQDGGQYLFKRHITIVRRF